MKKNGLFKFKNFVVHQEYSAMKVSTDACIFGIIAAKSFSYEEPNRILDIGSGTGLLSLIWSQEHPQDIIDAVELDEGAIKDCIKNIESNGKDNIHINHVDFTQYVPLHQYDIIISNPPFFIKSLKNENVKKSIARHADVNLTPQVLFEKAYSVSHLESVLVTLYPSDLIEKISVIAKNNGWYMFKRIDIKSFPDSQSHCSIIYWDKDTNSECSNEEFIIYDQINCYSQASKLLFKDYYLAF